MPSKTLGNTKLISYLDGRKAYERHEDFLNTRNNIKIVPENTNEEDTSKRL